MRRRDVLRKCVTLGAAGSLGPLAGCAGGGEESDSESAASLSVDTFDYREGDSGNLVVTVDVQNSGSAEGSGRLYVTVTASRTTSANGTAGGDGDDTVGTREVVEVTVPAGETETVTLSFEFTYDQFARKGSLNVDLRT